MKPLLALSAAALASCAPAPRDAAQLDALESCVVATMTVTDARVQSVGTTDAIRARVSNGFDWTVTSVVVEYAVYERGKTEPVRATGVRLKLAEELEAGDTVDLVLGIISDLEGTPPLRAEARVIDVKDTAGLPLVGRKPELAPAPTQFSAQLCEEA